MWGRRESKTILWLATSLSFQQRLYLLACPWPSIQALPVYQISSELIPTHLFSLTLLTHTSLVLITSFTLTPKFILAVFNLSSQPQTPETFPWKSHKLLVSPPSPISLPVFLNFVKYNHHPLSCSSQKTESFWHLVSDLLTLCQLQFPSVPFSSSALLIPQDRLPPFFAGVSLSPLDHFGHLLSIIQTILSKVEIRSFHFFCDV